ncbi:MAG: hypothetical protein ACFHU9_18195 [Fluviicola sp.]
MKNYFKLFTFSLALIGAMALTSCGKYKKYNNNEVIDNTYTGSVQIGSTGADPGGDFTGNGDSGEYSFAWVNSSKKANANFDITTPTGSVQMVIYDAKGNIVLDETRSAGGNDTFSGVTQEGKKGTWKVSLIFTNFNGDGSFSISPGS